MANDILHNVNFSWKFPIIVHQLGQEEQHGQQEELRKQEENKKTEKTRKT